MSKHTILQSYAECRHFNLQQETELNCAALPTPASKPTTTLLPTA
jgi:hypothetical protein